jgi:hypothetical protein
LRSSAHRHSSVQDLLRRQCRIREQRP